MKTFPVSWVAEKLATAEGLNVECENIDDICYGMQITTDKTFLQWAQQHSLVYNYQIIDGDPIRLVRRQVNDDLVMDFEIDEEDCIRRGQSPVVPFSRIPPSFLPRQVEIAHIDPARSFAVGTQIARHIAAPRQNPSISLSIDFVISAQQARDLAFDVLYRLWAQQLGLVFEHKNMRIEPGDTVRLTTRRGIYAVLVTKNTLNMPNRTNTVEASILLTTKGSSIAAGEADPFAISGETKLTEDGEEKILEDGELKVTEG